MQDEPKELGPEAESEDELVKALSSVNLIESILHGDDEDDIPVDIKIKLPMEVLLKEIPEQYLVSEGVAEHAGETVTVTVSDLFTQLARGKVLVTVADLASVVPADMVTSEAYSDKGSVSLPLPVVVSALDPKLFESKTAQRVKTYDTDKLRDPFARLRKAPADVSPTVAGAPGGGETKPASAPPPEPASAEPTPPEPAPEPEPESAPAVEEETAVPPVSQEPPAVPDPAGEAESATSEPVPVPEAVREEKVEAEAPVAEAEAAEDEQLPGEMEEAVLSADAAPPEAPGVEEATAEQPVEAPVELHEMKQEPVVEPAAVAEPAAPQAVPVKAEKKAARAATAASERVVEPAELEKLGGVNVNTATVEQLVRMEDVSVATATDIVKYRDANGPFRSVFELYDVPSVGRAAFNKLTGMPYSAKRRHRRHRLAGMLKLDVEQVADLPTVVKAVVARLDVSSCVLCDRDGLPVAQFGLGSQAELLSAVVAPLMRHITGAMAAAQVGTIETASLSYGGELLTMAGGPDIYLLCVHNICRLTKAQAIMVDRVATELEWLLSHRAYVGAER